MTTMTKASKAEQTEAVEKLLKWCQPGDTLYTLLKSRSRSGMSRVIQVIKIEKGQPVYLGWNVAAALGWKYDDKREGVTVSGCGMDMGFHLVYELSSLLFRNADGSYSHDGAYALKQRWL